MTQKQVSRLLWILVNLLIVLGIWLAGVRIGSWSIGGVESAGTLGDVLGYSLLVSAAILMWVLIFRGRFP